MHRYSRRRFGEYICHWFFCIRTAYRLTCPVVAPLIEPFLIIWKFGLVLIAVLAGHFQFSYKSTMDIIDCEKDYSKITQAQADAGTNLDRSYYQLCTGCDGYDDDGNKCQGTQEHFKDLAETFGKSVMMGVLISMFVICCVILPYRGAFENVLQLSLQLLQILTITNAKAPEGTQVTLLLISIALAIVAQIYGLYRAVRDRPKDGAFDKLINKTFKGSLEKYKPISYDAMHEIRHERTFEKASELDIKNQEAVPVATGEVLEAGTEMAAATAPPEVEVDATMPAVIVADGDAPKGDETAAAGDADQEDTPPAEVGPPATDAAGVEAPPAEAAALTPMVAAVE